MRLLFSSLLFLAGFPLAANAQSNDPLAWLQRAALASHQLNYTGTFVYQHDNLVETSRITHRADESGEQEKLEALDGPPRIVIRNNDEVICYLHGGKTFKMERGESRKLFPDVLPKQLSGLVESYNIRLGEQERVAGYDSKIILLEPKDALRYGHKLWADTNTGLLLRTSMLNEKGQAVDQFSFTQITIGAPVDKEQFKQPAASQNMPKPELMGSVSKLPVDTGWMVMQLPAGFKKIMELKRNMPGRKLPVAHLVYSDGLVAVSLFIEPSGPQKPTEGLTSQGAINVYIRLVGDNQVTALGEVPGATVTQFANSIALKNSK